MYDAIIIGGGVTGAAVARELSRYAGEFLVLEREEDVCCGTSKANSGIAHAGYDAKPGSMKARMNLLGSQMMEALSKELDFPYEKNGSLVVCTDKKQMTVLHDLYEQGLKNGVKDMELLTPKQIQAKEPNVTGKAEGALYAPTAATLCPFGLNYGLAENAAANGVKFRFDTEVTGIKKQERGFLVETKEEVFRTKCVVNAAGVYADVFHNMVSAEKIHITPRKGEYYLLDHETFGFIKSTVFQLPGKYGKGVLAVPTVHKNMMAGPTAFDILDRESTNTTREGLDGIVEKIKNFVPEMPFGMAITSFAGLRAHEDGDDFIVGEVGDCPGFFDCAGIESPGLTSAPAIGAHVAGLLTEKLNLKDNPRFSPVRRGIVNPNELSLEERSALIAEHPAYANMVCRCEMVSEGEILDAIHRTPGARSLDGVKRRTRAGMGRCQAGFCTPRTMEILARELDIPMEQLTKSGGASRLLAGETKEDDR